MKRIALTASTLILAGCALGAVSITERLEKERRFDRLMARSTSSNVQAWYEGARTKKGADDLLFARVLLDERFWTPLSVDKTICVDAEDQSSKPVFDHPSCKKGQIGLGPYAEPKEYVAFIKRQARRIVQGTITFEEADYLIVAKGNEIKKRFDDELARESHRHEMEKQTRAIEAIGRRPSAQTFIFGPQGSAPNFLCRDAIQSNNQAAIWVHC